MKALIIALLIALCVTPVAADNVTATEPDFAWGASSVKTQSLLAAAQAKWKAASSMPTTPECLRSAKNKCFDESYIRELVGKSDQGRVAYSLLDAAMARLSALDECKDIYTKAIKAAGSSAPASTRQFDNHYYFLRSRLKLALGLSRAAISRQITGPGSLSYCFQAMESSIDALRDAADDAQKTVNGGPRAESIRKLRSVLFATWEQAEKQKDGNLIGGIDLPKAFDESGLARDVRAQYRL